MAKPIKYPKWAENLEVDPLTGAENKVEPTEEFKLSGLKRGELLSRAFLNYQFDLSNQWTEFFGASYTIYDLTGSTEIDFSNGGKQTLSLAANTTLTEVLNEGEEVELFITSNGFTITWPASFDWGNAGAPTLTTNDNIKAVKVGTIVYATVEWSKT